MSASVHRWQSRLPKLNIDQRVAVQLSIIVITLVMTALLARRPTLRMLPYPIVFVAGWSVLRFPGLGPLAILICLLVVPFSLGTGTQTSLHMGVVLPPLFLGLWLAKMLYRRWFFLTPSPANKPVLALAGTAVLSLIAGSIPWLAFAQMAPLRTQIGATGTFIISAVLFLLVANETHSLKWLRLLVWTFIGLGAMYMVGRAIPGLIGLTYIFPLGTSGSALWIWLVALAGAQLLFNRSLAVPWRLVCGALTVLTLVVSLASAESRAWASGWLPALVTLCVLIWLRWPRGATLLAIAAVALITINFNTVAGFVLGSENEYSLLTRSAAWEIILIIIGASPWLGVGPANYYFYTSMFPILGWYVSFNSHNQYLDILAQTGLLGLSFFAWFLVACGRHGWRLRKLLTDDFSRAYVNASLAGLVGCVVAGMLGDWLIPFVYNVGIYGMRASLLTWMFLGGMVALTRIAGDTVSATASKSAPAA